MKRDDFVPPIPGRPCVTGLYKGQGQGEQDTGAGVARAWRGRGAGYTQFLPWWPTPEDAVTGRSHTPRVLRARCDAEHSPSKGELHKQTCWGTCCSYLLWHWPLHLVQARDARPPRYRWYEVVPLHPPQVSIAAVPSAPQRLWCTGGGKGEVSGVTVSAPSTMQIAIRDTPHWIEEVGHGRGLLRIDIPGGGGVRPDSSHPPGTIQGFPEVRIMGHGFRGIPSGGTSPHPPPHLKSIPAFWGNMQIQWELRASLESAEIGAECSVGHASIHPPAHATNSGFPVKSQLATLRAERTLSAPRRGGRLAVRRHPWQAGAQRTERE
eukprot:gene22477-biopygen16250